MSNKLEQFNKNMLSLAIASHIKFHKLNTILGHDGFTLEPGQYGLFLSIPRLVLDDNDKYLIPKIKGYISSINNYPSVDSIYVARHDGNFTLFAAASKIHSQKYFYPISVNEFGEIMSLAKTDRR